MIQYSQAPHHDSITLKLSLPPTSAWEIPPLQHMPGKSHQLHPLTPTPLYMPSSIQPRLVSRLRHWRGVGGLRDHGGHDALGADNDVGSRQPRRRRWPRRSWRRRATQSPAMQSQGDAIAGRCNRKRCNRRAMQARGDPRSRAVPALRQLLRAICCVPSSGKR